MRKGKDKSNLSKPDQFDDYTINFGEIIIWVEVNGRLRKLKNSPTDKRIMKRLKLYFSKL